MSATRVAFFIGALLVASSCVSSCVSDDATGRVERHRNARVWRDAAVGIADSPWQWAPLAAMAVALPIAANNDTQWSAAAIRDPLIGEPKKHGDLLLESMIGATAIWSAVEWYDGDDGAAAEVMLESALLTAAITETVKSQRRRQRPAGSNSNKSFPSGHTATAFVAATFVARRVNDLYAGPAGYLGYLSYIPAAVVALNRVENGRHYPSDVIAGMLLGTVLTNLIYNAHYGSGGGSGILPSYVRLVPQVSDEFVGLGMEFRF